MLERTELRILLIRASHSEFYVWTGSRLRHRTSYTADFNGYENFAGEIAEDASTPFFIIVDCIEEDFRHDTIAHVNGIDRKELLKRKLKVQFRGTQYRVASVIGREKTGRRDDNVLFSALSRQEMIQPWTDIMLRSKVPIKGISTPAYLLQHYANVMKFREEHLMLVNVESTSGIRQTYLKNGKVMLSRLSPWGQSREAVEASRIQDQVLQSRKYLERIKLVPYDRAIEVRIFDNGEILDLDQLAPIDELRLSLVEIGEGPVPDASSMVLQSLALVLRKRRLRNLYAPFDLRRYFHIRQARIALYATGLLALTAASAMAAPMVLRGLDYVDGANALEVQVQPLLRDYERLRLGFPETPIPSNTMAVVVETYDTISRQRIDPSQTMIAISSALQGLPGIRLTRFDWVLDMTEERQQAAEAARLAGQQSSNQAQLVDAVVANDTVLNVVLSGVVENTTSYQLAQQQVIQFIDALTTTTRFDVEPIQMPLDDRPEANVRTRLDGGTLTTQFVLHLSRSLAP